MLLADSDGVLEALLMVDIDHDAAEPRWCPVGTIPDAMIVIDEHGIIQFFSSEAERSS